jgi:hypothetical protein
MARLLIAFLVSGAVVHAQQAGKPAAAPVDPVRVDAAVRRGVEYLRTARSPSSHHGIRNSDELILLTLIHAGAAENDPRLQELLRSVLEAPLAQTYPVALQAMALEELDRVRYQKRIYHCAQFLVDNQAANGQWSYGKETTLVDPPAGTPTASKSAPSKPGGVVDFSSGPAVRRKPKVVAKLAVARRQDVGGGGGDNSNSQYAALGLRACHDAGIVLPREVVEKAAAWWRNCQAGGPGGEGGEKAGDGKPESKKKPAVPTRGRPAPAEPRGWGYDQPKDGGYGSMTAGAVGALVIFDHILGADWKKDSNVLSGLAWMAQNFSVSENPGRAGKEGGALKWHYYHLYALERVGMLCETDLVGPHAWYAAGAKFLLDAQQANGAWGAASGESKDQTWDTCFAILFLKRATRPLRDVASVDRTYPGRPAPGK